MAPPARTRMVSVVTMVQASRPPVSPVRLLAGRVITALIQVSSRSSLQDPTAPFLSLCSYWGHLPLRALSPLSPLSPLPSDLDYTTVVMVNWSSVQDPPTPLFSLVFFLRHLPPRAFGASIPVPSPLLPFFLYHTSGLGKLVYYSAPPPFSLFALLSQPPAPSSLLSSIPAPTPPTWAGSPPVPSFQASWPLYPCPLFSFPFLPRPLPSFSLAPP